MSLVAAPERAAQSEFKRLGSRWISVNFTDLDVDQNPARVEGGLERESPFFS